jgi:ribosomal protein S27E
MFTVTVGAPKKMKTIKKDESVARSRFVDCPVCKNHTLKLKRTVQLGRCKSCSESYKIIVVYVKTGRKTKTLDVNSPKNETVPQQTVEPTLPSWQLPSDTSLFSSSTDDSLGLSDTTFDYGQSEHSNESDTTSGQ